MAPAITWMMASSSRVWVSMRFWLSWATAAWEARASMKRLDSSLNPTMRPLPLPRALSRTSTPSTSPSRGRSGTARNDWVR